MAIILNRTDLQTYHYLCQGTYNTAIFFAYCVILCFISFTIILTKSY